ncbi:ABC transporter substrate-binding protein [Colwellia psychrerythraea]|nr:ABC transporter substrate-binding protein [Colwellia psychrerythraea]
MKSHIGITFFVFFSFIYMLFCPKVLATEYTIGLATWSGYPQCVQGFKDALASRGLVEGKQLTFIQGEIGADKVLQRKVANNLKRQNIDLVFSLTTPGTTIIKEVISTNTPIVFSIVTYPADSGLIESFEYSGNNLVGTSNYVPLFHSIDLLLSVLPTTKSVAIFHRKGEPNSKIQTANLYRYFKKKGIKVTDVSVENIKELKMKATTLVNKVDVFITTTDTLIQGGGELALIELSLTHKIPILSANKRGIEQGATFGVVADFYQLGSMAGEMAAHILLNEALPESIESKLQQPPTYLFNKNSMNKLGINVPEHLPFEIQWTR